MVDHGRPAGATALTRLVVPSSPKNVAIKRRFAVQACTELGWAGHVDTVALLVSEVATNAVLHGLGEEITVHVAVTAGRLRVEVDDTSTIAPVPWAAAPDDEGGRGLDLLATLAAAWSVHPRPEGKTVWFEIDR